MFLEGREKGEEQLSLALSSFEHFDQIFVVILLEVRPHDNPSVHEGNSLSHRTQAIIEDALERSLRSSDLVFRWTNDQYLGILLNTTDMHAYKIFGRICRSLREQTQDPLSNHRQVSLSLGIGQPYAGVAQDELLSLTLANLVRQPQSVVLSLP